MVRIIIGGIFILGGLSGKLVLIGTHSGIALAVLGGVMVLLGVAKLARGT